MNPLPGLPIIPETPASQPETAPEINPPILFAPSDNNISASAKDMLLHEYRWVLLLGVPVTIAWIVFCIIVILPNTGHSNNSGAFLILPFTLWSSFYYYLKKKLEDKLFSDFALSNGLTYQPKGSVDETYGSLFRLPGTIAISDILTGSYKQYESTAFLMQRTVQAGKSSVTYSYTAVELKLSGNVPPLLITAKGALDIDMMGSQLSYSSEAGATEDVNLEGDFNQYFNVRTPSNFQVPVREILTPDIMVLLEERAKSYSIEFAGDRMYIYRKDFVNSISELSAMYEILVDFASKLKSEIAGFQNDQQIVSASLTNTFNRPSTFSKASLAIILIFAIPMLLGLGFGAFLAFSSSGNIPKPNDNAYSFTSGVQEIYKELPPATMAEAQNIVDQSRRLIPLAQSSSEKAEGYRLKAIGEFHLHDLLAAEADDKTALSYDPQNSYAMITLGEVYQQQAKYSEAFTLANQAIGINPSNVYGHVLRSFALSGLHRTSEAISEYNVAISIEPSPDDARTLKELRAGEIIVYY